MSDRIQTKGKNEEKRTWKEALLQSGLPLEHSVQRALRDFNFWLPYEFKYWRLDEGGVNKQFSIDVAAETLDHSQATLHFLFECKYRHDSVQWFFCPDEMEQGYLLHRDVLPIVRDWATDSPESTKRVLAGLLGLYPLCGKGMEVCGKESNPKGVSQALQQLRFAVAPKVFECLCRRYAAGLQRSFGMPDIVVPMIVTTASIWRLRPSISIEDIRKAERIEDVAEPLGSLWLHEEPDNQLTEHNLRVLTDTLSPIKGTDSTSQAEWSKAINNFSLNYPWLILVVHFKQLHYVIDALLKAFASISEPQ